MSRVNLEQKIRPHDMETLEETEKSIEEVVGREGGGELDGVENGRFQYPAWVDDTPRQHR